jgi:hypothetical protein
LASQLVVEVQAGEQEAIQAELVAVEMLLPELIVVQEQQEQ